MNRLLPLLLLSLTLLTAACQKEKNEPELQGTWTCESVKVHEYEAGGRLIRTSVPRPPSTPYQIVIGSDSLVTYATNLATPYRVAAGAYSRQGDILTYAHSAIPHLPQASRITELTAHSLVLFHTGRGNAGGGLAPFRIDTETRYTR